MLKRKRFKFYFRFDKTKFNLRMQGSDPTWGIKMYHPLPNLLGQQIFKNLGFPSPNLLFVFSKTVNLNSCQWTLERLRYTSKIMCVSIERMVAIFSDIYLVVDPRQWTWNITYAPCLVSFVWLITNILLSVSSWYIM